MGRWQFCGLEGMAWCWKVKVQEIGEMRSGVVLER